MDLEYIIHMLRKKAGLSQEELAEKCQVSRQAIAKWERGDSVPTIDKLIVLAEIFNVSLDELVGRIAFDEHKRFKEYINKFAAADIPIDDEDEASAIVCRYLRYMEKLNVSPEDSLHGLIEIFLINAMRDEVSAQERYSTER